MISKEDFEEYFDQIEKKVLRIEKFYGFLYDQVTDLDLKEMLMRLKGEEKIQLELLQRLKELIRKEMKKT